MKPQTSFWHTCATPIIGLSPMDGITDPAFRAVVDVIGHPNILYTEFVSADGLCRNPELLRAFRSHETKTPLIGQLFGKDPGAMAEAAAILLEQTTISGIDINMGCPSHRVAQHGGGAALIRTPKLAEAIVHRVRDVLTRRKSSVGLSVKTRIGYDSIITDDWISFLCSLPIDAITLHGRTLKQQYTGTANWEELGRAATMAKNHHILLFGNGDVKTIEDAKEKIQRYTPNGVLIGRASLGNPWVFTSHVPSFEDRVNAALLHCQFFKTLTPTQSALTLRKHLGWYMKSIDHAKEIRELLVHIQTVDEALTLLNKISSSYRDDTV